jgi:nucleoside-diphosphate-sugar epimerase
LHFASITDPRVCREDRATAYRVNVTATQELAHLAERFVFISTGYVYGFRAGALHEKLSPDPSDAYAELKLAAERVVAALPGSLILRYFFPYGPGTKPNSLVNRLIQCIGQGDPVLLNEHARPWVNPIHVSDLVSATKQLALGQSTGVYNVAGREVVSIRDLADRIGVCLGTRPVYRHTGKPMGSMIGCIDKLEAHYVPQAGLDVGLARTVAHLQQVGSAPTPGTARAG